jgi:hypothetical protein
VETNSLTLQNASNPAGQVILQTDPTQSSAIPITIVPVTIPGDVIPTAASTTNIFNKTLYSPVFKTTGPYSSTMPTVSSNDVVVTENAAQTVTNKTLTNPTILNTNLAQIALPSNTASDTLVVENYTQLLTNKTLLTPTLVASNSSNLTLPTPPSNDIVVSETATQTLTNKTFVAPALGTVASGQLQNCGSYLAVNLNPQLTPFSASIGGGGTAFSGVSSSSGYSVIGGAYGLKFVQININWSGGVGGAPSAAIVQCTLPYSSTTNTYQPLAFGYGIGCANNGSGVTVMIPPYANYFEFWLNGNTGPQPVSNFSGQGSIFCSGWYI